MDEDSRVRVMLLGQVRHFYKPTRQAPLNQSPPDKRLRLEWVHGYRGYDSHQNLWLLNSGELLYYVGAVAVLYNHETKTQRHYQEHTEDITCMTIHPGRNVVASGQRAPSFTGRSSGPSGGGENGAQLRVWGLQRLDTLHVLSGVRQLLTGTTVGSVLALSFSCLNQGAYLAAVIDGGASTAGGRVGGRLTVWTWHNQQVLGKVSTDQDRIYGMKFHSMDNNLLVTYGYRHLKFWSRNRDGLFSCTDLFGNSSSRTVMAVEFDAEGDLITGDSEGFISSWSTDYDGKYFKKFSHAAHQCAISHLLLFSGKTLVSAGDEDRNIFFWDYNKEFNKRSETKLPDTTGSARTLCFSPDGGETDRFFVGTTRNNILLGSINRRFTTLIYGHSRHLWALAAAHEDDSYVTAGYDCLLMRWSHKHKLTWRTQLAAEAVSCCVHPSDRVVAVGAVDGHLYVHKMSDGVAVGSFRVCGQPLGCMKFSPEGDMLVVGAQSGNLYPYRVAKSGFVYVKMAPVPSMGPLTQLDWSLDGQFIQLVTVDHQLVYWNRRRMIGDRWSNGHKNREWFTQTCTIGYNVLGAWPNLRRNCTGDLWMDQYEEGHPVKILVAACRSNDLLTVGDSQGNLQIYRYPCVLSDAGKPRCHSYKQHSSYVAAIQFLQSQRLVVTAGGTDATLLVWRLV